MSLPPLRAYQRDVLGRARDVLGVTAQSVLIVSPTGTGKTRTAVEACVGHARLGGSPMFVAPRRELVTQAKRAIARSGLSLEAVTVRTIQELSMAGADIPHATMVVLDEARHYVADAWSRLRTRLPKALYLGLDATPERADGRGLAGMYDVLLEAISIGDAIKGGYLTPCDVLRPASALGPRELAQDPVDAYVAHAMGESAVLFAPSVELAQKYASELVARGVKAEPVWGDMPDDARDDVLRRYDAGEIHVLCNVQILTEGWDSPRTSCVILASSVTTAGGLLQRVGRGLRPHARKERCLVLDLPGVTHLFGEPHEDRVWALEGRACRREGDEINVRFCPVCGAIVTDSACEACGHDGEMRKRKPRVLGLPMDRFARQHAMSDEEAAPFLAGYLRAARARGHQPWWAYKAFSAKYGRPVTARLKQLARRAG